MRRMRVLAGAGWGSAVAALLVAVGGTAIAAPFAEQSVIRARDLARGSVTTSKLRNGAVTRSKIRNRAVTAAKLGNSSVRSRQILDNSVTGSDINEATLGTVPAAALAGIAGNANNADRLGGRPAGEFLTGGDVNRFFVRLAAGETRTLASNGAVSLVARCRENVGGQDIVDVLGATTATNSFLDGSDNLTGGPAEADFLQPTTAADDRQVLAVAQGAGGTPPQVVNDIDDGFVLGSDGSYLGVDGETAALGLNALGAKCLVVGTVIAVRG